MTEATSRTGPVEREFLRMGRGYVAHAMIAIALGVQLAALLAVDRDQLPVQAGVLAFTTGWSAYGLSRLRRTAPPWTAGADLALVAAVCLAQPWIEVAALARLNCGWVPMAAEAFVVGAQWIYPRRFAWAAAALLSVAYAVGALALDEQSTVIVLLLALWLGITGAVSSVVQALVHGAGRRIDEVTAHSELVKQDLAVARARRESQAEHLATLHDTVAATLLMVGLGSVRDLESGWLREQAGRDLAVLTAASPDGDPRLSVDLETELRATIRFSDLSVRLRREGPPVTVPPTVAAALAGAVGEALRNVSRHAGVLEADVRLRVDGEAVRVTVSDDGCGFVADARPGRGMRFSITERVERVGGTAGVASTAEGVRVTLDWPRAGGTA